MKTILFNPFEKYAESRLLLFGIVILFIGTWLCTLFNMRFIGVLKMNPLATVTTFEPLTDIVICVFCVTLFLWIAAKLINNKTRIIDIFVTAIVSFSLLCFLSVFNTNGMLFRETQKIDRTTIAASANLDLSYMMFFALVSIVIIIWFVILLYNGFKIASNAKSTKHNILFVVALILADVTSRLINQYLNS